MQRFIRKLDELNEDELYEIYSEETYESHTIILNKLKLGVMSAFSMKQTFMNSPNSGEIQ